MSNLDVKKVIKALELCRYDPDPGQEPKYSHSCMKCPYGQPYAGAREHRHYADLS